jgi:hypothetical protein
MGHKKKIDAAAAGNIALKPTTPKNIMAYQLYQLFPRDIARHIHFSINPTPAQRRARDLEAHKKEYYLLLETISEMGESYAKHQEREREDPEDWPPEGLSFIAWVHPSLLYELWLAP